MPEFLEKRFNAKTRWFLSIFSLMGYILTKVSVSVYAGGVVIESLLGIDFWTGAFITVILTGIYTILGGMRAVLYTEALQTVILIVGALAVTFLGLREVGGWAELQSIAGSDHFNMWRPSNDPDFPWTGLLFGGTIVGIWYWCTDQYIVQRTLAAKNVTIGRRGAIFGAFLKILPIFIFLIPGIIAYALSLSGKIELASSDQALPVLMAYLLPPGIRGLVAAGLLAALMSSLASVFNSCSTLFTVDIYKKLRPQTSEKKLVQTGRIATLIVVGLGIAWIPVMSNISGVLYEYLQSVQSYIAPPITAVFLLGISWKRMNAPGAMATLIGGFVLGMSRLIAELNKEYLDGWLFYWADLNFLHFCILLFAICLTIGISVSLVTQPQAIMSLQGLTFGTLTADQKNKTKNSYNVWDIVASAGIVLIIIFILTYFTG